MPFDLMPLLLIAGWATASAVVVFPLVAQKSRTAGRRA